MITEDKVTELFCIADDFCKFFDAMMEKYTIKEAKKRNYHRDSTLSPSAVLTTPPGDCAWRERNGSSTNHIIKSKSRLIMSPSSL